MSLRFIVFALEVRCSMPTSNAWMCLPLWIEFSESVLTDRLVFDQVSLASGPRHRAARLQDPGMGHLNRTTEMEYDAAGRVIESTDPKNQTSTFEYNGVGQPTEADLPGETVTYTYGANGRTASVTDNRGTTSIAYETNNDRVASVTDPITGTIEYTYNVTGERATLELPGGNTWTYSYRSNWWMLPKGDPNAYSKMLDKITDDQGKEVFYYFDTRGKLYEAKQKISGSVSNLTTYTYDSNGSNQSRGHLAEIKNEITKPGFMGFPETTLIVKNAYTYDNNGNRLTNAIYDNAGLIRTEEYGYDALNRLTSVNYGDGQTQSYSFDAMGNRSQKVDSISGTENYTYNNANMLLTRGANSYTNDSNGNTLTGGGRTNTWDGQNRLTQCVYSGTTTTFTYGSDRLRRSTASGGTTTTFVLDEGNMLRELQGGSAVATYLHGPRGPECRRDGSNVYRWYVYGGLGSILAEVDASGNVTATRKYDVFGAVRGSTGTGVSNHKFVGSLGHPSEDSTGLIYMRARYCDPTSGRFVSEDPILDGKNWYAYANQNPVNVTDYSGYAPTRSTSWWDRMRALVEACVRIYNQELPPKPPSEPPDDVPGIERPLDPDPEPDAAEMRVIFSYAVQTLMALSVASVAIIGGIAIWKTATEAQEGLYLATAGAL